MAPSAKLSAYPGSIAYEHIVGIALVAHYAIEVSGLVEQSIHSIEHFERQSTIDDYNTKHN